MRILLFLTILFCSFVFSACVVDEKTKMVNCIEVKSNQIEVNKEFYGTVKAQHVAELSFQTEGKIVFFPFAKGDFVKKGQVIAKLDGGLYKIKKKEEQAKLQEILVGYEKSKSYFARMDVLHKEGAISDHDWEDAYFGLKSLDAQIKTQKEKVKYLEKEIDYNNIVAPFDGYIASKESDVGNYAKIGVPVATLINSSETQIEFLADSSFVNNLFLFDEVQVVIQNKTYDGKIIKISKTSQDYGGYPVKISLFKKYDDIKDGMSALIKIPIKSLKIFYLPLECLFEEKNNWYIYKIVDIS